MESFFNCDESKMEVRTVYCRVLQSNRRIKFVKTIGKFDVDLISKSLVELAEKDNFLGKMLLGKPFILQMNDENGVTCDIEPDDDVKNGTQITVQMFEPFSVPPVTGNSDSTMLSPKSVRSKIEF